MSRTREILQVSRKSRLGKCCKVAFSRHEDRNKALSLCNWPTEQNTENLTKFIDQLEKEKAYTRAAAIAVFNLKISTAIDVLSRAPTNSEFTSNLNVVAMALSGFSDDKTSVWRQFCALNKTKLSDSYLKAIFAFLTTESHNYDNILVLTFVSFLF